MAIGNTAALLFRIRGDASDAVRAFAETGAAEKELSATTATTGSAFSALAGPVAGVVAILGAATVAGIGLGKELFNLAKEASDYGSSIHDAAQQTGLAVETVQALKFAAEQSGSSFEAISGAVAKFSALMGEAKNGNEKALATLHQYHIELGDTDAAIAQAIKTIASMTDHDLRAAAAKELFRDRAAAILPVIESFDGDLPKLINHLRDLGLIMGKDATNAADAFGDQMDELDRQMTGVWRNIGTQLLPVFLKWSKELSGFLANNQEEIKSWGNAIAAVVDKVARDIDRIGPELRILAAISRGDYIAAGGELAAQTVKENTPAPLDPNDTALMRYRKKTGGGVTDPDAEKAADEARRKREEAAKRELAALTEKNRLLIQSQRDLFAVAQKEWEEALEKGDTDQNTFLENSRKNILAFSEGVRKMLLDAFNLDIVGKTPTEIENATIQYHNAIDALNRQTVKASQDATDAIEKDTKRRSDALDKAAKEEEKRVDALIEKDKEEGKAYADKIDKENEKIREQEKAMRDLDEVLHQQLVDLAEQNLSHVFDTEDHETYGPFQGLIDGWQHFVDLVNDTGPDLADTIQAVAGLMSEAFDGFANALGNVVEQWVLTGETGPAVMRKILATALATLAAEAAVRALWELALGFATLFFDPAESAAHFAAAAIFGAIAGVAAVAGRAVAGDALKKNKGAANTASTGSSGKGASAEGQGQQYSSQPKGTIEEGRNTPSQTSPFQLHVTIADDSKWLGKMLKFDFETNGQSRRFVG